MFCINCGHTETRVSNSRPAKKAPHVWRRRQCLVCKHAFTTDEAPRLTDWSVTPRTPQGVASSFNPGKLLISIAAAFAHDQEKGTQSAWPLTQTVMTKIIQNAPHAQLTAERILLTTHETLAAYDQAAAAQYALSHQMITSLKRRGRPSFAAAPASSVPETRA